MQISQNPKTHLGVFFRFFFALFLLCQPAWAVDSVVSKGKLSDRDFYRLIACAAPPGAACQRPFLRWSERDARDITVRIVEIESPISARRLSLAKDSVQHAVNEINGVGAAVKLRLIDEGEPDIAVSFITGEIAAGDRRLRGVDDVFLLGSAAAVAEVFSDRRTRNIDFARVTISRFVSDRRMKSVVLEEIVQSLGLMTDVHNQFYHHRSVFSETGSSTKRLRGQDAMAVMVHYPN